METSEGEERRGRRGGRGIVELHSPCHRLQMCINALLKCLGFELGPGSTARRSPDGPDSQASRHETLLEEGEEEQEEYYEEERRWTTRQGRPTRPPIGTGGGGQTN
ncbi:hypothetical protein BT93_H3851 [Corymbia citriodora subsp. variegata]|nr:hypothetical protein BT93_H3851 [Corymbia citriodora subsp. variegata]